MIYKIVVDGYCKVKKYREGIDFVLKIKDLDYFFDDYFLYRLFFRIREDFSY